VEATRPNRLTAAALLAIGVVLLVVLRKPVSGIGSGFLGAGGTMLILSWTGPLDRGRRRTVGLAAFGGVVVFVALAGIVDLVTVPHSAARFAGDTVLLVALLGWVFVIARALRNRG
jgi:MFS family permease